MQKLFYSTPKEMGGIWHQVHDGRPQRTEPQKHISALYSSSAKCYEKLETM